MADTKETERRAPPDVDKLIAEGNKVVMDAVYNKRLHELSQPEKIKLADALRALARKDLSDDDRKPPVYHRLEEAEKKPRKLKDILDVLVIVGGGLLLMLFGLWKVIELLIAAF